MVNYENSKIYKIEPMCNHLENEVYIGSTTKTYLSQRLQQHKCLYNNWKKGKYGKVMVFELFDKYGFENCNIFLIEKVNCTSIDDLRTREGHYIKTSNCINKKVEGRTDEEKKSYRKDYYEMNKTNYKESSKRSYNKNKETIKVLMSQKVFCYTCNCEIRRDSVYLHNKSKKHLQKVL
jgi:hypothetical protein